MSDPEVDYLDYFVDERDFANCRQIESAQPGIDTVIRLRSIKDLSAPSVPGILRISPDGKDYKYFVMGPHGEIPSVHSAEGKWDHLLRIVMRAKSLHFKKAL